MVDRVKQDCEVPVALHGQRLDQAASQLFSDFSRARLQGWIKAGQLLVDGAVLRPKDKVSAGAQLQLRAALEPQVTWQPQALELDILHEDETLLLLNKPAGLVVHPAAGHDDGTLVNALLAHFPQLEQLPRAGIVHRLDRDTSGIMVVAKTLAAHKDLVAQLQARTVKREYTAVCLGALTGGGKVDAPMGRHPRARKKMAVLTAGGKRAVTHYRIATRFGHHTQLTVTLETGRTHQIRVHMAHVHHPLVGDPVYGGRPRIPKAASARLIETLRGFSRQALHAQHLTLIHPGRAESLSMDCPIPQDMGDLLAVLAEEDPHDAGDTAPY